MVIETIMKNGVLSLLAVLAIAGCQTKELEGNFQDSKHFTATIEDSFIGAETKTYLDENGNVRWKQGDQVSIFAGSTVNEQYQVTDASDGKTSAGFNKVSGGGFVGGGEIDNNVAFYPYASTAEIAKSGSSYVISDITLPATQTYAENSFGNGAFPMAAVTSSTTDMHLKFKNVLGGLKLQLKGTASIASISISGNNNEILCGAAKVTVSNSSTPSINLTDATATTVTLDCGDGVQLNVETATPFVIALPPMTMEGGFTVVVTDTEGGTMEIKTTKTQTINRSNLLKMPAVVYEGIENNVINGYEYVDLGFPTMWATRNLGASSPEQEGNSYAWGETEPKSTFNWTTYKWCDGTSDVMTKYNESDWLQTLEAEDDAATVNIGAKWETPNGGDWSDLKRFCTWTLSEVNGQQGYLVTSTVPGYTDKSIFLPSARSKYMTSRKGSDLVNACIVFIIDPENEYREVNDGYLRCGESKVRPITRRECYHNQLTFNPGVPPTNFTAGYREYYQCRFCGQSYEDAAAKVQIENLYRWKNAGGEGYLAPIPYEDNYVDLGLSVKWAISNLGASSVEDYGDYYAWGETAPKDNYDRTTYKWYEAPDYNANYPTKYNDQDNKYVLDLEDDAAHAQLGGNWRTPTKDEWIELIDNCTSKSFTVNGINGLLFTSKISGYTDRQIFFPNAGYYYQSTYWSEWCYYMCSNRHSAFDTWWVALSLSSSFITQPRESGTTIRPVLE